MHSKSILSTTTRPHHSCLLCQQMKVLVQLPLSFIFYSASLGVRCIVINPSVCESVSLCVYVCLSASISLEPLGQSSQNLLRISPVAVARSSSVGFAIRYVLPVLWLTSRLAVVGRMAMRGLSVAKYSAPSGGPIPERSPMSMNALLLRPGRVVEYCDQFVCLCVCVCLSVCERISGTAGPIVTKFFVQIPCGRGSVLLWRRCDMLCISGFVDDASEADGDTWRLHVAGTSGAGQSLMSMNALFPVCIFLSAQFINRQSGPDPAKPVTSAANSYYCVIYQMEWRQCMDEWDVARLRKGGKDKKFSPAGLQHAGYSCGLLRNPNSRYVLKMSCYSRTCCLWIWHRWANSAKPLVYISQSPKQFTITQTTVNIAYTRGSHDIRCTHYRPTGSRCRFTNNVITIRVPDRYKVI